MYLHALYIVSTTLHLSTDNIKRGAALCWYKNGRSGALNRAKRIIAPPGITNRGLSGVKPSQVNISSAAGIPPAHTRLQDM